MSSLLSAVFYLWLVITVLLVALYLVRRREQRQDGALTKPDSASRAQVTSGPELITDDPADRSGEPVTFGTGVPFGDDKNGVTIGDDKDEVTIGDDKNEVTIGDDKNEVTIGDDKNEVTIGAPTMNGASPSTDSVVEMLDGVEMPVDLDLRVGYLSEPETHAVFLSPHGDAAQLGTAFADELVRVGFEVKPQGYDLALAVRREETLTLRICPEAKAEVDQIKRRRYPFADDRDIAIEVWTGAGPAPEIVDP